MYANRQVGIKYYKLVRLLTYQSIGNAGSMLTSYFNHPSHRGIILMLRLSPSVRETKHRNFDNSYTSKFKKNDIHFVNSETCIGCLNAVKQNYARINLFMDSLQGGACKAFESVRSLSSVPKPFSTVSTFAIFQF